jgi:AcrR family transcriptional regulator
MARKAPRRTAERILETTLELFNRFGEPNVSTTVISAELSISPGNLYYHYPAKDELVNALYLRYEEALLPLLEAGGDVKDVEDAWFFLHSLFELLWQYRFFYRDLNHLLSRNRLLEMQFQLLLPRKTQALQAMLQTLRRQSILRMEAAQVESTATSMTVLLTYWLSFEYVRDPRHAMEPENAQAALLRGAQHVLGLLGPHLQESDRAHLHHLAGAYA